MSEALAKLVTVEVPDECLVELDGELVPFGESIIKVRTKLGWTRKKLMEQMGTTIRPVVSLENNLIGGRVDTFLMAVNALGYRLKLVPIEEGVQVGKDKK